jgi:glucose-6-phosphate 1-dehydrogenase
VTGDLSQSKLIPALYELFCASDLPEEFTLIGYGRREFSAADFAAFIANTLPNHERAADFCAHWRYVHGAFDNQADFARLADTLNKIDPDNAQPHLFYLAVAPEFYQSLTTFLNESSLLSAKKLNSYLLIEKPFGSDGSSADALTKHLHEIMTEEQIYRMDHFLGKQAVRDILTFRAAQAEWQPTQIMVTVTEDSGIGNRGAYYDAAGVLRDMVQNHCLMLLALITMPLDGNRSDTIAGFTVDTAILGQYDGYRSEANVSPDSQTPTFAALTLHDDAHKAIIITGKKLRQKLTQIRVSLANGTEHVFAIQPSDKKEERGDYATLFLDALHRNRTFFVTAEDVHAQWSVIDPVIAKNQPPISYSPGSDGPNLSPLLA